MTSLIVRVDEALEDETLDPIRVRRAARAALGRALRIRAPLKPAVRALLTPDPDGHAFQRRYREVLHARPEVVLGHRAVMSELPRRGRAT